MNIRAVALLLVAFVGAGCAGAAAPTDPSGAWSRHDLGVDGPLIGAIVPGGPGYIGVGGDIGGTPGAAGIWTSADGLSWTAVETPPISGAFVDIAVGGPGFVAITASPPTVWTSADGLAWSEAAAGETFETATLLSLASTPGRLVAVGLGGFWTSTDGLSWKSVAVPGLVGWVHDVAAGGPGFVAVGNVGISSMETKGVIWTSLDGERWTRVEDSPIFERADIRSVGVSGGTLVAAGFTLEPTGQFRPAAWRSTDGLTWDVATIADETIPTPTAGNLEGALMSQVGATSSGWLGAGVSLDFRPDGGASDVALWLSADGSTWERLPHRPMFEVGMSDTLGFGPARIVATGERTLIIGMSEGPQTSIWASPPSPGGLDPTARPSAPPAGPTEPEGPLATPAPMAP